MSELCNERPFKKVTRFSSKTQKKFSSKKQEVPSFTNRNSEIASCSRKRPRPVKRICFSETPKFIAGNKRRRTAWSESDKYSVKRKSIDHSLRALDPKINDWIEKNKYDSESVESTDSVCLLEEKEHHTRPEYISRLASHDRLSKYDLGIVLGSGSFGEVYAATRKTDNLPVAIKFVHRKSVREFQVVNGSKMPTEAYLQWRARHRHVIDLYEVFLTEDHYVYVMERPERCIDLFDILQGDGILTEKQARRYFFQIVEANLHCERRGVLHRDLKPENILVDLTTHEAKLIDFGLASEVQEKPFKKFRGTNEYCPPEFFDAGEYDGKQATVWQLGILLVEMLSQHIAFENPQDALTKPPNIPVYLSSELKNLISSLLNTTPMNRPTLQRVLHHPWFWIEN